MPVHRSLARWAGVVLMSLGAQAASAAALDAKAASSKRPEYPSAPKGDVTDTYHGVSVADPYRWLEDPDSAETRAWVEAENKITFGYLEAIPARSALKERLTKLWDYEKFGAPSKQGDRYFYSRNSGLQNQAVLFTTEALDGPPQILIDPNTLSTDGTVALAGTSVSEDGNLIAYRGRCRGVGLGRVQSPRWWPREQDRPDLLKWIKFSGAR